MNQVLHNLHLLFNVNLTLCRLHDQIDPQFFRLLFGSPLHLNKEWVVCGFHHESNFWRAASLLSAALTTDECKRQDSQ